MNEKGECLVNNFIVGREDYGEVKFLGLTDVRDLNLDEIGKFWSFTIQNAKRLIYQPFNFNFLYASFRFLMFGPQALPLSPFASFLSLLYLCLFPKLPIYFHRFSYNKFA